MTELTKKDTTKASWKAFATTLLIVTVFIFVGIIVYSPSASSGSKCDEYEVTSTDRPDETVQVLTCGPNKRLHVPGYTIRRMEKESIAQNTPPIHMTSGHVGIIYLKEAVVEDVSIWGIKW